MAAYPPGHEPGWREDPEDSWRLRWWDGQAWTDHTQERWSPTGRPEEPKRWPWVLGGGVLLVALIAAVVVVALVVLGSGDGDGGSSSHRASAASAVPPVGAVRKPASAPAKRVPFGETVTVRDVSGQPAKVTTISLIPLYPPASALVTTPKRGFRIEGLRMRLLGISPGTYMDYVENDTEILAGGKVYKSLAHGYSRCDGVDSDHRLKRFEEESGCLLFSLPRSPQPSAVRYRASSQYGPKAVIWSLR